jgi:phosphatidylcholine synthase
MRADGPNDPATPRQRLAAWAVHFFTAMGAFLGVLALWDVGRGDFAQASIWMLAAMSIDAVDGSLARRARVSAVTPGIDGRRLDDIVDYLNFAIVPVVFLLAGGFVHWSVAALPTLASAYGFAQVDAKTDDDFFLVFPSYWNVLAIYLWLFDLSPVSSTAWVVGLSLLVFVPLKYCYPSKLRRFRAPMVATGVFWVWVLAFVIWFPEPAARWRVAEASLVYPAAYFAMSAWLGEWWKPARAT